MRASRAPRASRLQRARAASSPIVARRVARASKPLSERPLSSARRAFVRRARRASRATTRAGARAGATRMFAATRVERAIARRELTRGAASPRLLSVPVALTRARRRHDA